jgi:hypothetical protein
MIVASEEPGTGAVMAGCQWAKRLKKSVIKLAAHSTIGSIVWRGVMVSGE